MKKNILVAATAAAAGVAYYFLRKRKSSKMKEYFPQGTKPSQPVTDIFSRAEEKAVK